MLEHIRTFFDRHLALSDDDTQVSEHALRLAAAALLLEVSRADYQVGAEEAAAVAASVQQHFGLTVQESRELMRCAEAERAEATDYHQFTSLINQAYTAQHKAHLVEMLWRVAYSDKELHRQEEHLIRKIADLLYVPHRTFIAAKHRAKKGTP